MEMKRSIYPFFGALAFAGLMTTGVGISTADTIKTEGNYPTRQACQDASPGVKASTPGNGTISGASRIVRRRAWRLVLSN